MRYGRVEAEVYRTVAPVLVGMFGEAEGDSAAKAISKAFDESGFLLVVRRSMFGYLVEMLQKNGKRVWGKWWPRKARLMFVAAQKVLGDRGG